MLPKSKRVRAIFLFTVIASFVWCVHFPYSDAALSAAIPGRAVFVSTHDSLGPRWKELVQGGLGRTLARVDGIPSATPYLEYSRPAQLLMGKRTISAFVPGYTPGAEGKWVVSSWLGAKSHLFRWGAVRWLKCIRADTLPDRTPYWIYSEGASTIVFAVRGGVLVSVFGDDSGLLQDMLRNLDGLLDGSANINQERLSEAADVFPGKKDVAWAQAPVSVSGNGGAYLALSQQDDGVLLDAVLRMSIQDTGNVSESANRVSKVCGDLVDAIAVGKWDTLRNTMKGNDDPVLAFLDEVAVPDADVFISVMKEDFSGKIYITKVPGMLIKVPVILAGLKVKSGINVTGQIPALMDKLNAEKGLGIIPVKMPTETAYPIIVAGGSKMNLFGGIKERPALTVRDEWLIVCSDMQSLLGVLLATEDRSAVERPRWAQLMAKESGLAGLYVDFTASEKAIRNAIAFYTLSLMNEGKSTPENRGQLDALRATVEALADIGEASAVVSPAGDTVRISFLLGSEEGL